MTTHSVKLSNGKHVNFEMFDSRFRDRYVVKLPGVVAFTVQGSSKSAAIVEAKLVVRSLLDPEADA